MNTNNIVLEIDTEISRLQQARTLLSGTDTTTKRKPGRPAGTRIPSETKAIHSMSAETRANMAAAQKARWAKVRKAAKKAAPNVAEAPAVNIAAPNGTVPKSASVNKAVSAKKVVRAKTKAPVKPAS